MYLVRHMRGTASELGLKEDSQSKSPLFALLAGRFHSFYSKKILINLPEMTKSTIIC